MTSLGLYFIIYMGGQVVMWGGPYTMDHLGREVCGLEVDQEAEVVRGIGADVRVVCEIRGRDPELGESESEGL